MTLWQSYTLKVCIHACVCIYILDYSNLCVISICVGVEVTLNGDSHIHFRSQAVLLACTCDLPARALLTNMVQFNGYYACLRCTQKGKYFYKFTYNFNNEYSYPKLNYYFFKEL